MILYIFKNLKSYLIYILCYYLGMQRGLALSAGLFSALYLFK